jgi:hypothetical protein
LNVEGKSDRELYAELMRVTDELVRRFEQYLELAPIQLEECEASRDEIEAVRLAERLFRISYERCFNIREMLADAATA